jgi:hypothetical protein
MIEMIPNYVLGKTIFFFGVYESLVFKIGIVSDFKLYFT